MLEYLDRYQDEDLDLQYAQYEMSPGWTIHIRIDVFPGAFAQSGFRPLAGLVYDLLFIEKDGLLDLTQTPSFQLTIHDQMGTIPYQTSYDTKTGASSGTLFDESRIWLDCRIPYQINLKMKHAGPIGPFLDGLDTLDNLLLSHCQILAYFVYDEDAAFQEVYFWGQNQRCERVQISSRQEDGWHPGHFSGGPADCCNFFFYGRMENDAKWIKALPCLMQIAALNDAPGKKDRTLMQISTSSEDEGNATQQISQRYFNFSTPYRIFPENKALLLKSLHRVIDCLWQMPETECFGIMNQMIFFDEQFFVLESWSLNQKTGKLSVYHLKPG